MNHIIRSNWFLLILGTLLGLLFNLFFYQQFLGLNVLFFSIFFLGVVLILDYSANKKFSKDWIFLIPTILLFAVLIMVRSNILLVSWNAFLVVILFLYLIRSNLKSIRKGKFYLYNYNSIQLILAPLSVLGESLRGFVMTVAGIFRERGLVVKNRRLQRILFGIFISLPFLFLFTALFISADLVFREMIFGIIDAFFSLDAELLGRFFWWSLASVFFLGSTAYLVRKDGNSDYLMSIDDTGSSKEGKGGVSNLLEVTTFLSLINLLFFSFILIQLSYLFGGLDNISETNFTYADYARRGFAELVLVALVTIFITISTGKIIVRKADGHFPAIYKLLIILLSGNVMIMMVSAFKRLWMYEEVYGFTFLRILSHSFTILLGIIFLLIMLKVLSITFEKFFIFSIFFSFVVYLTFLNLLNPDKFILERNLERQEKTGKLDIKYIADTINSSEDHLPQVVDLINSDKLEQKEKCLLVNDLRINTGYLNRHNISWYEYNYARDQGIKSINKVDESLWAKCSTVR